MLQEVENRKGNMKYLILTLVLCLTFLCGSVICEKFESQRGILDKKDFRFDFENHGSQNHELEKWISNNEGKLSADMPLCNKTTPGHDFFYFIGANTEILCFKKCTEDRTCKEDHKCLYLGDIFREKCIQTCSADDDCEYPMKCVNLPRFTQLKNKFCFWKECTEEVGCEYPLKCSNTMFGNRCVRRFCYSAGGCKEREKCHPVARGCECADGMSGPNCRNEAWCKHGKFKNCNGKNGTCRYNSVLNAVECSCKLFPEKRLHPEENRCIETCNADSDCLNGGVCENKGENKYCSCKAGVIGDKCETVFDCSRDGKYKNCERSGGNCSYDGSKATCECFGNKLPYDKGQECRICKCGPHETCKFVNNEKQCDCNKGFLKINGTCIGCNCRGGECVKEGGKPVCKCPPGYGNFTSDSCKACDCGPNIDCLWEKRFGGNKICLCESGFSTQKGKCVACDCGPDSKCEWINEGWLKPEKKVCHCKPGYHEENGKCVDKEPSTTKGTTESSILSTTVSSTVPDSDCNCGSFSYSCSFDSSGKKVCSCFPSYSQLSGSRAECNCGPYGSCRYEDGRKKCNCKSFATEINGVCVGKQDIENSCKLPIH